MIRYFVGNRIENIRVEIQTELIIFKLSTFCYKLLLTEREQRCVTDLVELTFLEALGFRLRR